MAAEKQSQTITNWVVIALSPVLVMLMVGSLVFFLVEVLYAGQYSSRLIYTLFFFVIGAVLIARISIEQGSLKARLYGLGLGVATFIAIMAFVEYPSKSVQAIAPLINLLLMAVVWWSANKLTWDCTHLDEDRKASGRGVLAAAGLGEGSANAAAERAKQKQGETEEEAAAAEKDEKKKRKKDPEGFSGWLARWNRFREAQRKKPHTPGTWIVYFSLAAFPIFGLGQSLIAADDTARRRATFMQMAVYVGSGLMLLVTTSLLGLRKYLRERSAKIPAQMTMGWLGIGAGLILLFLAVGALLPRPHSETPLVDLPRAGKSDRKASKYAQRTDDGAAGKGEGKAGNKNEAGKDAKKSGKNGEKGGNAGEKGDGDDQGGDKNDGDKGGKQGEQGKNKGNDKNQQKKQNDQKNGPNAKKDDQGEKKDGDEGEQSGDAEGKDEDKSGDDSTSSRPSVSQMMEAIGGLLKWVTWFVIAALVIVGLFVFFLKYLAPFTAWARNLLDWLRNLFARKAKPKSGGANEDDEAEETAVERPPPFSDFPNPFEDGTAKRMTLPVLVAYTFAAFEAWGYDHDLGRTPDETPNEFAAKVGEQCEELTEIGRQLATLYVRSLYSNADLPAAEAIKTLKQFWKEIEVAEPVVAK